jgi:N-formylglutamate deformylase
MGRMNASTQRLPVLISIPHGGLRAPEELDGRLMITEAMVFADSDAFTRELYDLGDQVMAVVQTDIARCFINLNRTPHELPPDVWDGVIKDRTSYGERIYHPGREPDDELMDQLIARYYFPYHQRLKEALALPGLKLALDCHSMAAVGTPFSRDAGKPRAMICISNAHGATCPPRETERLADCLASAFGLPRARIAINAPFAGGYISRTYGQAGVPWIQVELNKTLYLEAPWFNPTTTTIDPGRLTDLRTRFGNALRLFFA